MLEVEEQDAPVLIDDLQVSVVLSHVQDRELIEDKTAPTGIGGTPLNMRIGCCTPSSRAPTSLPAARTSAPRSRPGEQTLIALARPGMSVRTNQTYEGSG